jgi:glycosyltransferase involved in cell wall biosynthesis
MNQPLNRILVFLPSYNDRELLLTLTTQILMQGENFQPLVIDDGSRYPIRNDEVAVGTLLTRVPANFGLGMATHIAFDHAIAFGYSAIARIDADGQHPVEMLKEIVSPILDGTADIVVAERTNRNSRSGFRQLISRAVRGYLSVVASMMTKARAPKDVNSGFFAANPRAAQRINEYNLDRFPEPQIYVLAPRNGLVVSSVDLKQADRIHGHSTVTLGHAIRLFYRFNIFVLAELLQKSGVR